MLVAPLGDVGENSLVPEDVGAEVEDVGAEGASFEAVD